MYHVCAHKVRRALPQSNSLAFIGCESLCNTWSSRATRCSSFSRSHFLHAEKTHRNADTTTATHQAVGPQLANLSERSSSTLLARQSANEFTASSSNSGAPKEKRKAEHRGQHTGTAQPSRKSSAHREGCSLSNRSSNGPFTVRDNLFAAGLAWRSQAPHDPLLLHTQRRCKTATNTLGSAHITKGRCLPAQCLQ